jgi:hypothetical protein
LRAIRDARRRELAEVMGTASARLFSTPERREREQEHLRGQVAEAEARVAEVEAELARLEAEHAALEADCRIANSVAQRVLEEVDNSERQLLEELGVDRPGHVQAPRVLPEHL